ncbi:hypothetical protein PAPYR_7778 [Paratrimastix pyriformis]|uniref:Uncharacterized protein n=1 Tax=Paratrimastix pyriformis TaxID=342808 RepID=A0ABQ8UC50_9EUKA|nr:hypothetical protein PAPYR_7778 [Paratrimastix pyriformis]
MLLFPEPDEEQEEVVVNLAGLSREILVNIVQASSCPIRTYCQFLGTSHTIRAVVRGSLRELVFAFEARDIESLSDAYERHATLTTDTVAALVGPCKGLTKLIMPRGHEMELRTGGDQTLWVDEAFTGHDVLSVLDISGCDLMPVLARMASHLHGLEELSLSTEPLTPETLAALSANCPRLRALRTRIFETPETPLDALGPLLGIIQELALPAGLSPPASAILGRFTSLRCLSWRDATCTDELRALAPRLTHLTLGHSRGVSGLIAMGFRRLEELALFGSRHCLTGSQAARLLAANQGLRAVELRVRSQVGALLAALGPLAHLTRVSLQLPAKSFFADLPPVLHVQFEELRVDIEGDGMLRSLLTITGPRLRHLILNFSLAEDALLSLACPALEVVTLPGYQKAKPYVLAMDCPRLRLINGLGAQRLTAQTASMPQLFRVESDEAPTLDWLAPLLARAPRLAVLNAVVLPTQLAEHAFSALLGGESSTVAKLGMGLDFPQPPEPSAAVVTLRLPASVQRVALTLSSPIGAVQELRLEAPGLQTLQICGFCHSGSLTLALESSPALRSLAFWSFPALTSLVLAPEAPLDTFKTGALCDSLEAPALIELFTRHGSLLERVSLSSFNLSRKDAPVAQQLLAALGALPKLTHLSLSETPTEDFTLASLSIKHLTLPQCPNSTNRHPRSVTLNCPRLEVLHAMFDTSIERALLTHVGTPLAKTTPAGIEGPRSVGSGLALTQTGTHGGLTVSLLEYLCLFPGPNSND